MDSPGGTVRLILTLEYVAARFAKGCERSFTVTDLHVRDYGTPELGIGVLLAQETSWQGTTTRGAFRVTRWRLVKEGRGLALAHVKDRPGRDPGGAS